MRCRSGAAGRAGAMRRDEQVHLAAEAEAEGCVEEGRDEREPGGDGADAGRRRRGSRPSADHARRPRPTAWANRGGAASSSSAGAPSRGRTSVLNSQEYGVCEHARASTPIAKTTACTASRATVRAEGAASSATASTTVVSDAAKRGPRGSIWRRAPDCWPWFGAVVADMQISWTGDGRVRAKVTSGQPEQSLGTGERRERRQEARQSAERTRQLSTARRRVSIVDDMGLSVRSRSGPPETGISPVGRTIRDVDIVMPAPPVPASRGRRRASVPRPRGRPRAHRRRGSTWSACG